MSEFPNPNREQPLVSTELSPGISEIEQRLHDALPGIATDLISRSQDMSDPANQSFATSPDNPAEHAPKWHQYGILTHSYEFGSALQTAIPALMERWGLAEPIATALSVEIDGLSKGRLLQLTALVHDVGKFTARRVTHDDKTGTTSASFEDHEEHSGRIIRDELRPTLREWGLTESQIEYVATCAELHFELGKVRRASKAAGGYTVAFTESPTFTTAAQEIIDTHFGYALEIGLQFIADSLSKTEVAATAETDEGIAAERPALEAKLATRGLNPSLINQVLQQPVNMKVAQGFLRQWAAGIIPPAPTT